MSCSGVLLSGCCGRSVPQVRTISFNPTFFRPLLPPLCSGSPYPLSFNQLLVVSASLFASLDARLPFSLVPGSLCSAFFFVFSGRAFVTPRVASVRNANGRVNLTKVQYADGSRAPRMRQGRRGGYELLRLQTQSNSLPDSWIDFNIDFVLELDYWPATFAASFPLPALPLHPLLRPVQSLLEKGRCFIPSRRISKFFAREQPSVAFFRENINCNRRGERHTNSTVIFLFIPIFSPCFVSASRGIHGSWILGQREGVSIGISSGQRKAVGLTQFFSRFFGGKSCERILGTSATELFISLLSFVSAEKEIWKERECTGTPWKLSPSPCPG